MYNLEITKYYNSKSDIHNMNPLYKVICILITTVMILLIKELELLLIMLMFEGCMMILSNVPLRLYFKSIKYVISIIIFIFVINLIFNISTINSINSSLKLILFILNSGVLIYTTKSSDLLYGLEMLFSPLKIFNVPVNSLSLSISLAIRFIPIIFEQANKVLKSQISRGLNSNGTIREKCDKLISILFPIFMLSFKRSDSIADALDLRLYNPNINRTKYKRYKITSVDDGILLMHIALIIIYIISEVVV